MDRCRVSGRRACALVGAGHSTWLYKSRKTDRTALRMRLKELAATRRRFGYRRLMVMLRGEGWYVNHKLVYWLYSEEGLGVGRKTRRDICSGAVGVRDSHPGVHS